MRVAVVTPFYQTPPDWLAQCHASVRAQTHPCTHFLVSDGSGENPIKDFEGEFIRLPRSHGDFGDTPRTAGFTSAIGGGFDAIAALDADNWLLPGHVESLVRLHQQTGSPVCASARDLFDLEGVRMGRCTEVDGKNHVDTSCYFLTRQAFALTLQWVLMPAPAHLLGDFWLLKVIQRRNIELAFSGEATVAYRTSWPIHYRQFGMNPPTAAKPDSLGRRAMAVRQGVEMALANRPGT